jgi:hypothetical protein
MAKQKNSNGSGRFRNVAIIRGEMEVTATKSFQGKNGEVAIIEAQIGDVPVSALGMFTDYFKRFEGKDVVAFCQITVNKSYINVRCVHVVEA